MSQISFHPAPGLGDLAPGFYVVPQNPVRPDSTVLVPSVQASAPGMITRKPHIGEFVAASFVLPQNPIIRNLQTGMQGLGGGLGCGCGTPSCNGGPNYYGMSGFDISSVTDWLQAPSVVSPSIPNWALWGGAAAAAWLVFMPGGSEYRAKKRALASQYRGYRRVAGRVAA